MPNFPKNLLKWEYIIGGIVSILVCFLVIYPLVMLLYGAMRSVIPGAEGDIHVKNFVEAFTDMAVLNALKNTLLISLATVVSSFVIAVPIVWMVSRTNTPGAKILETLNLIPFLMSPFILGLAWTTLANPTTGLINVWLHTNLGFPQGFLNIYTSYGIVFCLTMYYVPYVYLFLVGSFKTMNPSLEESARTCGATLYQTITRVTLPLAMPAIFAAVFIVFVHCAGMFGVPGLLGLPRGFFVLSTKIYGYMRTYPVNYNMAATVASALLLISVLGVFVQKKIMGNRSYITVTGKGFRPNIIDLGPWKYLALAVNLLYLLVAAFLPVVTLLLVAFSKYWAGKIDPSLFTVANFKYVLFDTPLTVQAIKNSLYLAFFGGGICLFLGLIISYVTLRTKFAYRHFLDFITTLPVAIPGMVIAVGLLWAWIMFPPDVSFNFFGRSVIIPIPIYGTINILALGYITRYIPYGLRAVSSNLISISPELEESARVSGASWLQMMRLILLRLLRPGLAAGWIFIFIYFVRELDVSILLWNEESVVIPVAIWNLMEEGTYGTMCAMALVQTGIIFLGILIFKLFVKAEIANQA
ncbi:MAG: iron ABC transporter permease [Deltaproteobacteria bacterium]|nr:MAG: iron ABC transporter permease [Deltaproteobacteria bacterium]